MLYAVFFVKLSSGYQRHGVLGPGATILEEIKFCSYLSLLSV